MNTPNKLFVNSANMTQEIIATKYSVTTNGRQHNAERNRHVAIQYTDSLFAVCLHQRWIKSTKINTLLNLTHPLRFKFVCLCAEMCLRSSNCL